MYDIEISNRQNFLDFENGEVKRIVEQTLIHEGISDAEISIALIDNKEIHRLNRKFLSHDYATDVLSFLYSTETEHDLAHQKLEGEVVVSTEMGAEVAQKYGWSTRNETILYLVHGLLHLVGYDDQTDKQKAIMRQKERDILGIWNLVPPKQTSIHSSSEI